MVTKMPMNWMLLLCGSFLKLLLNIFFIAFKEKNIILRSPQAVKLRDSCNQPVRLWCGSYLSSTHLNKGNGRNWTILWWTFWNSCHGCNPSHLWSAPWRHRGVTAETVPCEFRVHLTFSRTQITSRQTTRKTFYYCVYSPRWWQHGLYASLHSLLSWNT